MIPTIEVRLRSMISAIEYILIPALDSKNSLAHEQADILIGHIKLLLEQNGYEHVFEGMCLADYLDAAVSILDIVSNFDKKLSSMFEEKFLSNKIESSSHDKYIEIGQAIEDLIEVSQEQGRADILSAIADAVLSLGERQCLRGRVWFARTLLDPQVANLPSIQDFMKQQLSSQHKEE